MHTPAHKANLSKYLLTNKGREISFIFEGVDEQLALAGATVWTDDYQKTKRYRNAVKVEFRLIVQAVNAHERLVQTVNQLAFELLHAGGNEETVINARALLAELEGKE